MNVFESAFDEKQSQDLINYIDDVLTGLSSHLDADTFEKNLHLIYQRIRHSFYQFITVDVQVFVAAIGWHLSHILYGRGHSKVDFGTFLNCFKSFSQNVDIGDFKRSFGWLKSEEMRTNRCQHQLA